MSSIGAGLSLAVSLPIQIASGLAVKAFADIEDAAYNTALSTGHASKQMVSDIMENAKLLSRSIPIAPVKIAEGQGELIRAHFNPEFSAKAIEAVAKTAYVVNQNLDEVVKATTRTFYAFGLNTGLAKDDLAGLNRVMDVSVRLASENGVTYTEFAEAMERAASPAKRFGLTLEQTAAIVGSFGIEGLKGARGGSQFEIMLRSITTAAEHYRPVWDKALGKDAIFDATGNLKPLGDVIDTLQKKLAPLSTSGRADFLRNLKVPQRAVTSLSELFGLDKLAVSNLNDALNSAGTAEERYQIKMESLSSTLLLGRNAISRLAIGFGFELAPTVRLGTRVLEGMENVWVALPSPMRKAFVGLTVFLGALGPGLLVMSGAIRLFAAMSQNVYKLAGALGVLEAIEDIPIIKKFSTLAFVLGPRAAIGFGLRSLFSLLLTPLPIGSWLLKGAFTLGTWVGFLKEADLVLDKALPFAVDLFATRLGGVKGIFMTVLGLIPRIGAALGTFLTTPLGLAIATGTILVALMKGLKNPDERMLKHSPIAAIAHPFSSNFTDEYLKAREQYYKELNEKKIPEHIGFFESMNPEAQKIWDRIWNSSGAPEGKQMGQGDKDFKAANKKQASMPHYYSATELGTKEEYTARVRGQSSIFGAAAYNQKMAAHAARTEHHTRETVRRLDQVKSSIDHTHKHKKSANLK